MKYKLTSEQYIDYLSQLESMSSIRPDGSPLALSFAQVSYGLGS